jgi:hypothetical protein
MLLQSARDVHKTILPCRMPNSPTCGRMKVREPSLMAGHWKHKEVTEHTRIGCCDHTTYLSWLNTLEPAWLSTWEPTRNTSTQTNTGRQACLLPACKSDFTQTRSHSTPPPPPRYSRQNRRWTWPRRRSHAASSAAETAARLQLHVLAWNQAARQLD